MNSLHPTQTAQIIQFPELGGSRKFLRKRRVERMARVREAETAAVPLTETCKNARSREGRKGPWDVATSRAIIGVAGWIGNLRFR